MHKHIRAEHSKIKEVSESVISSPLASSLTTISTRSVISVSLIINVTFIALTLTASFLSLASSIILDDENTYSEFSELSEFSKFSKFSEISEISETTKIHFISDIHFNFNSDFNSDFNFNFSSDFISDSDIIVISVYNNKDISETPKVALTTPATSIIHSIIYSAITCILSVIKLII